MNSSELSPADIAAVTGGNNGGMFGGDGSWLAILFLFALFGWGRGGAGGFGGGVGGCYPSCASQADVRAAVDQQTLISKLDNQTYGLADSTYALNNTIVNGFHGVDRCCCETQRLIERGFADTNYNLATQFCDTRNAIHNSTRDIVDNQNCNTRAILDFLTNDKISTLTAENQALKFQASQAAQNAFITANQEAQTAELIRRLGRDCPVPAYVVPNPNCCYNPIGFNFGGCGGNGFNA